MPSTLRRTIATIAIALAGLTALASCSPSPSPTTSSTSTTGTKSATPTTAATTPTKGVEPPTSADGAIKSATAIVNEDNVVVIKLLKDPTTDLALLATVEKGSSYANTLQMIQTAREQKWIVTGSFSFSFSSGSAGSLEMNGVSYPYAAVTVNGCQDTSNYKATLPDGTPLTTTGQKRALTAYTAAWDPVSRGWYVTGVTGSTTPC